jgi:hypothetical protein
LLTFSVQATDIPGIPEGLASDGTNYLNFIKKMKTNFPFDKTVSIAAPASYWYLKAFPIKDMSESLDYIVYMTYDLHGKSISPRPFYTSIINNSVISRPMGLRKTVYPGRL